MDDRSQIMSRQSPAERVVDAVAAYSDTDPLELPPLYETIDTNALDGLFRSNGGNCTVTFEYADYEVTVVCGQEIELVQPDG